MSSMPTARRGAALSWHSFEGWVGTRRSGVALFLIAGVAFALQSAVLPVGPGRDMGRYVQAFLQLGYHDPLLTSVADTRGPLASLGVGVPLELGGTAAEVWLGLLYAASIVAWSAVAMHFGPRAALLTAALLLVSPPYAILFHGLSSDSLVAAAFAGWALLLARAILRPSLTTFAVAGLGMGGLVLVRPANQLLIVITVLPFVIRAPWGDRARWAAGFFIASTAVTQGWKVVMTLRYGDATGLKPSGAFLAVALVLAILLAPAPLKRWLVVASIPLVVLGLVLRGGVNPVRDARALAQSPPASVFLFRAFEIDRIVSPDNGPESRRLASVVKHDLLPREPYRSYGVTLDDVFSSGSDRIFGDVTGVSGGIDLSAVTSEAIRTHPRAFASGIARTARSLLWARVFASEGDGQAEKQSLNGSPTDGPFVVVNGRRLPAPSEGQPIPASRIGPVINTLYGGAREVWRSPTEHSFVFDDPRDEHRYEAFQRDTDRLASRIPTRSANESLVHRLNQASRIFPPPFLWLVVGAAALAIRRPSRSLVAIGPAVAGLVVILGTALVAVAVSEYALPVTPAFILLAAAGLVGADPQGTMWLRWRRRASADRRPLESCRRGPRDAP
jgi:hypothetical protein